jgi:uncharacterized membrane protein
MFALPILWILPVIAFIYVIYVEMQAQKKTRDGEGVFAGEQEVTTAKVIFGAVFLTCVVINMALE